MKETFEYSRQKYLQATVIPTRRKARVELAAALGVVLVLVGAYVTQHVLGWW